MIEIKHRHTGEILKTINKASLHGVNLRGADLREADLGRVDLGRVDLSDANLYGANLYEANLSGTNLRRADFRGANIKEVNFSRVDLYGAKNIHSLEAIKNQICKNCEYYEKYPSVCCNGDSPLCAEVVDEDFGCNRFSKKE